MTSKPQLIPGGNTVYISGAFDLLTPGDLDVLTEAKSLGSRLIVGLIDDNEVCKIFSENSRLAANLRPFVPFLTAVPSDNPFPIFSLQERALALLSLGVVDDVVMAVPPVPTPELLTQLNIQVLALDSRDQGDLFKFPPIPEHEAAEINEFVHVAEVGQEDDLTAKDVLSRVII